ITVILVSGKLRFPAFTCRTFSTPRAFCTSTSLVPRSTLAMAYGNTRLVVLSQVMERRKGIIGAMLEEARDVCAATVKGIAATKPQETAATILFHRHLFMV